MASPNISFDQIPASIRKPGKYAEFNTRLAVRTLPANLQKTLMIGQRLAAGTQLQALPVDIFSDAQAATLFGKGSMLHLMCRAAIKANPYLALTAIALDDAAAGVAGTSKVTFAGPATGSGGATLAVGDQRVDIAVTANDTAALLASALVAQIGKQPDLPITAATNATPGEVILTAKHKGTLGNAITLKIVINAGGVTAVVVPMSGGLNDPDIQTALTPVFGVHYHIICTPYNDQTSLTTLRNHLDATGSPLEKRGAVGVYGHTGTLSQATTLAALINHGRITSANLPKTVSLGYELGAAYAAVIAGEEDPSRPLNLLELKGIAPPAIADRLGRVEQENALYNGVTPLEVGPGERAQIVRAISTYTKDPQGVDDISLLDITTIRIFDYVRKAWTDRMSLRFPREKLSQRTPPKVRTETITLLFQLEELEILENVEEHLPGVLVERDSQDPNRLNVKIPTDVVNGLHIIAGRIDLYL